MSCPGAAAVPGMWTAGTARVDLRRVSDDEVMVGVKCGSVAAFGALYDRYHVRAYRVARSICRDDSRAQEAVQEAFMSIWKTAADYQELRGLTAWLLTVVRNRAIDNDRRSHRHVLHRVSDVWLKVIAAPDDVAGEVIARDDARCLAMLLEQLPDEQQEVIGLAFYDQLSHTEIAAHLELPLGTVKGRIRLAICRLRNDMAHASAS